MPFDSQSFEVTEADVVDPVLECLTVARDLVSRGWCQGTLSLANGSVCMLGGVGLAGSGPEAVRDTVDLLIQHLPPYFAAKVSLPKFNDHPTTKQGDVLAVFDSAIASRRGMK